MPRVKTAKAKVTRRKWTREYVSDPAVRERINRLWRERYHAKKAEAGNA